MFLKPHPAARLRALIAALAFLAVLAGCGGSPSPTRASGEESGAGYPVTVTDSVGREVRIDQKPQEIASMAPSITETLFAVGAGGRVVGVTTSDDYPAEVKKLETVGDYSEINVEKVLALETDLLFVSFDTTAERADKLQKQTGADVVVVDPKTLDEVLGSVETVATAAGERENGRKLRSRMRSDLDAVEKAVADRPEPSVFYEVYGDPLQTVGPGSFINDAIRTAGGRNIAANTNEAYPTYSEETLIEKDPDFYLLGSFSGTTPATVAERPGFGNLKAVTENHVKVIDDDLISRPGPRVVEGVRQIAEAIHPEAF